VREKGARERGIKREVEREREIRPRALPESELNLTDCQLSQSLPIINFRFCCMFYVGKGAKGEIQREQERVGKKGDYPSSQSVSQSDKQTDRGKKK